jgi:hypothetical protein
MYGYFRNQRFNAANALAQGRLPMTQGQYGITLGGPITKDRTFYFGNFEQRNLNQSGLITLAPANVAVINSRLAAVGYPGPLIFDWHLSEPSSRDHRPPESRSPVQFQRSIQRPLQCLWRP